MGKSSHVSVGWCTDIDEKGHKHTNTVRIYATPFLHMLTCPSTLHMDSFSLIKADANGLYATYN